MSDTIKHSIVVAGYCYHWSIHHRNNFTRRLLVGKINCSELAVNNLPVKVEVEENAIVLACYRVVSKTARRNEVAVEVAEHLIVVKRPVFHVVLNMANNVRHSAIVFNSSKVDAIHLAVYIDCTTKWSKIFAYALIKLGQSTTFFKFKTINTFLRVVHSPRISFSHTCNNSRCVVAFRLLLGRNGLTSAKHSYSNAQNQE